MCVFLYQICEIVVKLLSNANISRGSNMIQILKMMFAVAGGLLGDNTPSSSINLSKISYLI